MRINPSKKCMNMHTDPSWNSQLPFDSRQVIIDADRKPPVKFRPQTTKIHIS